MNGYVVFWRGPPGGEEVDWRPAGSALPAGAVPAVVCDGRDTTTLHGHGVTGFGARIAMVQADAEAEMAVYVGARG